MLPMLPQFLYENLAERQMPLTNPSQITFLHDVYSVAQRLLLLERSIIRTASYFVQPMEFVPITEPPPAAQTLTPNEASRALEPELRHFFIHVHPQLVASAAIESWGRVRIHRPTQILIAHDVIQAGGRVLVCRDERQSVYRRHVLHAAIIIAHEALHSARLQLSVSHPKIPRYTPPKVRSATQPSGKFEHEKEVYRRGENGWRWELDVIGGSVAGQELTSGSGIYKTLILEGLEYPMLGMNRKIPDVVVDMIVKCEPGWTAQLPIAEPWSGTDSLNRLSRLGPRPLAGSKQPVTFRHTCDTGTWGIRSRSPSSPIRRKN